MLVQLFQLMAYMAMDSYGAEQKMYAVNAREVLHCSRSNIRFVGVHGKASWLGKNELRWQDCD